MGSLIESLIISGTKHNVMCQTDTKFSEISSNQCSWCAVLFAKNGDKLGEYYRENRDEFNKLYEECLREASELRKKHNSILYGENIDRSDVLCKTKRKRIAFYTLIENDNPEFRKILHKDILSEFYTRVHLHIEKISDVLDYNCILVSRHGQAFTIIKLSGFYLVLDSHVHTIGLMTRDNIQKYIRGTSDISSKNYLHLTIVALE